MYTSKPEGIEAIVTYNSLKKIDAIAIQTNGLYLDKRWLMQKCQMITPQVKVVFGST